MSDGYHVLQNQLQQLRDYIEAFWYNFPDPLEDGATKALFVRQDELLEMLDEFGVTADVSGTTDLSGVDSMIVAVSPGRQPI